MNAPTTPARTRPVRSKYEKMPIVCLILYGLALVSIGLYIAMSNSATFADWFNRTISAAIRCGLSYLTGWIPFSLGELAIWMLPVLLFLVLRHAIKYRCSSWRTVAVYLGMMLSVVSLLFSLFVLTFAAGYRARPLSEKLEMERDKVSVTELYDTTISLIDAINTETAAIRFYTNDFSIMPYTFADMNDKLAAAYDTFSESHDFLPPAYSHVKPVAVSEVMSHMHITGVYSFFTGEANVNVGFPDYTIPSTAAHELAHQRGVAREDEASFLSFLVCIGSDDPYIRYSGYMMAYEYVANALWSADHELYYDAVGRLNPEVAAEQAAYREFFKAYEDTVVSDISSSINNSYLQSQGTPGVKSYGMVVDLVVAYYRAP